MLTLLVFNSFLPSIVFWLLVLNLTLQNDAYFVHLDPTVSQLYLPQISYSVMFTCFKFFTPETDAYKVIYYNY